MSDNQVEMLVNEFREWRTWQNVWGGLWMTVAGIALTEFGKGWITLAFIGIIRLLMAGTWLQAMLFRPRGV